MSSTLIGLATLACIVAGYALGLYLKWRLPEHHVIGDSRDTVKQTIAVLGTVTGVCLGLVASRNATNGAAIIVGAVSLSAAIFLILEMDTPYEGVIRISEAPLRLVLEQLGK
jgi:hypothetical protein